MTVTQLHRFRKQERFRQRHLSMQMHRGVTLLEVLVSLCIVGLLVQVAVQGAASWRQARQLNRDARDGVNAAMAWRVSRAAGQSWALGKQGELPDLAIRWYLGPARTISSMPEAERSDGWRVLQLCRNNESTPFWRMVVFLQEHHAALDHTSSSAQ